MIVFVVPPIVLFPIKIAGLWLLAHGHWVLALGTLVLAKLAGVGVAAFIFDATKPKLLQMDWFRWCYEKRSGRARLGARAWRTRISSVPANSCAI